MKIVGGKLMSVCPQCAQIIRLDKPVLGSLHFCTTDEERRIYRSQIQRQYGVIQSAFERISYSEKTAPAPKDQRGQS